MNSNDRTTRFYRELWPHRGTVLRSAQFLTHNLTDAEDLAQETMIKAFKSIEGLTPGTNARAWLITVLRTTHVDRLRVGHESDVSLNALKMDLAEAPSRPAEDATAWRDPDRMLAQLSDQEVISALKSLSSEIRWTLLLVDIEGLKDEDAAAVMEVPPGTVKSRVHRGRRMLREALLPLALDRRIGTARRAPEK